MADKVVRLSEELHKKAKLQATKQGINIKDWLERVVKEALKAKK